MKLSQKETEIITLVARGFEDKEIGTKLKISGRTVQTHLTRIMLKLNARNRTAAAISYIKHNPEYLKQL